MLSQATAAPLLLSQLLLQEGSPLLSPPLVVILCAIFGALIGSFLNVVIHRLPRGESIAFPNSRCPHCGTAIKFYDNVPVLGYVALRGRCRACGTSISARYPAVEALTAALFAAVALYSAGGEFGLRLVFDLAFVGAIIALVFIDAEHMILPNKITYPGFVLAVVARSIVFNLYGVESHAQRASYDSPILWSLINSLLGALVGGGSLWLVGWIWKRLRGVDAMGLGDVKMMLMVGAYLGVLLTPVALFVGFLGGALIGVIWMWRTGTRDTNAQIPFGVSLGIGSIISLLFGTEIVAWYLGQFRY